MTSKIDFRVIVVDHYRTMVDAADNRISSIDIAVMLGAPAIGGIASTIFGISIEKDTATILISGFAIFAGLLLNVLLLIYSLSEKSIDSESDKLRTVVLGQTFSNISYSILVAIITVILLSLTLFIDSYFLIILSGIIISLCLHFILCLLMILKRVHILMRSRFL